MESRTQHEKQNFIIFEFCDSNEKSFLYLHCKSQKQYYQQ